MCLCLLGLGMAIKVELDRKIDPGQTGRRRTLSRGYSPRREKEKERRRERERGGIQSRRDRERREGR